MENKEYKIYINHNYQLDNNSVLEPNVYEVALDNEEYDKEPTIATIITPYGLVDIYVESLCIWGKITNNCYAVYPDFDPKIANHGVQA